LFISIDQLPFLASTIENADPLFAMVITPGYYLHYVEVADQDPVSGSLEDLRDIKHSKASDNKRYKPNYSSPTEMTG